MIYNSNLGRLPAKRSEDDTASAKILSNTVVWMTDESEECRTLAGAKVMSTTMVDTDLRRDANEGPCPTWDTVYFETTHKHHKSEAGCQARAWLYDGVRMFSKNQQYSGVQQELRKLVERGH